MREYVILFCIITFLGCEKDVDKGNYRMVNGDKIDKNIPAIIDTFTTVPYTIKHKPKFIIPDSLGGTKLVGFVVLTVEFDSLDNIIDFEIEKLHTQNNSENAIDYIKSDKKKDVIREYERLCGIYLKKMKFKKNPLTETQNGNMISFLLRFNE